MALVLASQSPRRRELFSLITPDFVVDNAQVDESGVEAENPRALAGKLAQQKALAVAARRKGDVVIGCDTVVEVDGLTLGKPADAQDAMRMLERLSGNCHRVHTGVCVVFPGGAPQGELFVETTDLQFASIPQEEMLCYIKTPEAYDKAGGYGIQGWAARFVQRIEGCYYNVMGLPVAALYQKLVALELLPDDHNR